MIYLNELTEKDLYIAYKKVKFELFNDKNTVATFKLLEYENDLENNIKNLYKDLQKNGLKNISCNQYYEIPKKLEIEEQNENKTIHFFSSAISHHKLAKEKITLYFRKVINADINFHIISALWIDKIGQYIDAKFGDNIYGSRLIRIKPTKTDSCEFNLNSKPYNLDSPRIFESYQHKYQSWRNNSFKAIRELHKTSSVIAVTMDITSFYHSIKLDEFKKEIFYREFELDKLFKKNDYKRFHEDFIDKLEDWNKSISKNQEGKTNGLPIGLSASAILANAVMRDFDKKIDKNLSPAYYGRYVDDILLVFSDNGDINSGNDVIKYLISKKIVKEKDKELKYKNLILKKEKQKIFYLDKNADLSIIDAIESEINSISSEWRFMPDIANKHSSLLNKIIGFYADGKEFNDALRKIDATTIKRLGLSLLLSHAHSLNQFILPKEWKNTRYKIYSLIENHMFIPQNFFANFTFIPKIFRLMLHSGDGEKAYCFLKKVFQEIEYLNAYDENFLKESNGKDVEFEKFEKYVSDILQEVLIESFNILNTSKNRYSKKILDLLFNASETSISILDYYNKTKENNILDFDNIPIDELDIDVIRAINSDLFKKDLSFDSYSSSLTEFILTKNKKSLFFKIMENNKENDKFNINLYMNEEVKYIELINKFNIVKDIENLSNYPLIFPTRLFSVLDISIIISYSKEVDYIDFKNCVNCLRGNHSLVDETLDSNISNEIVEIKNSCLSKAKKVNIAITNFKVNDNYWKQSVIQRPIKTVERYNQVSQIVKEAVSKKTNYLVLPELAIPQEWAWLISKKLLSNNISLITGVEYIHTNEGSQKIVHNSIMKFLISDDIGFNYMKFYRQDKIKGAHSESIELKNIANINLIVNSEHQEKKIYKHGNFYFSSLICNELTDIENRMIKRGKIDALFIVEWNKDIKSFNALVESAALDIHCYVVQVNNRQYGDSRIRAPYSKDFLRDIVQVKGGNHDYLIVGEINIEELRDFQSHNISPSSPFKPVPTGFIISEDRKEWQT